MEWKTLLSPKRKRITTVPTDEREEFERDFDRSVFSTPLKRLQDKAQVFPLEPHDAIRTRLTHSLEVSSVARGLARTICSWLSNTGKIDDPKVRQIEAIAATCGLIHDLGNPPFGHSGEDAIRSWFESTFGEKKLLELLNGKKQLAYDFLRFEGNAQTLRLVSRLQILSDFTGLNLTFGTLSALMKYVARSHETDEKDQVRKKPGFFASEEKLVQEIREETGTDDGRNPISVLVEAADDIVYLVCDLEDGVKKGITTWIEIDNVLWQSVLQEQYDMVMVRKERILKAGGDRVPSGLPDDAHATAFRVAAIGLLVHDAADTFRNNYEEIMAGKYRGELVLDGTKKSLISALQDIGASRIYCTPSNLKLELMGRRILSDLLALFWEGIQSLDVSGKPKTKTFPGKINALLSQNYKGVFCWSVEFQPELPELYHRFRLLTDYICGMTDTFAKKLHAELTNH